MAMNSTFNTIWILPEDTQTTLNSDDTLIRQLTNIATSQSCGVLTTNNAVQHLKNPHLLDAAFHVYDHSNQLTLLIPKIKSSEKLLADIENIGEFASTSIATQQEDHEDYEIHPGATLDALKDVLKANPELKYFFLSGHGNAVKRSDCLSIDDFLENRKACGTYLAYLIDMYRAIKPHAHGIFQQTCFGTDKDIEQVVNKENLPSLISMSFDGSRAKLTRTAFQTQNYNACIHAISSLGQLSENQEPDIFKALDLILDCKNNPCNIPYIMWPHHKYFKLLQQAPYTHHHDGHVNIYNSVILTRANVSTLAANPIQRIAGGNLNIDHYRIKELKLSQSIDAFALLNMFNSTNMLTKKKFTIQKIKTGKDTLKNALVTCAQNAVRLELKNDQGGKISITKKPKISSSSPAANPSI